MTRIITRAPRRRASFGAWCTCATLASVPTPAFAGDTVAYSATNSFAAMPDADPVARRVSVSLSLNYTNDYYFRGILQEDDAVIFQQSVEFGIDFLEWDGAGGGGLSATFGMWNSFHDSGTGANNTDGFVEKWYESDLYAGLGATFGPASVGLSYIAYTSPNDAFGTISEIDATFGFDDSEWLGVWALNPSATLAFEIGNNSADGGSDAGVYLELGIAPGHTYEGVPLVDDFTVSVPVTLGLSLSDYYQDADGDDDTFGYVDIGLEGSTSIPIPDGYGALSLNAGVHFLLLGDHTKEFNTDESYETIFTVGLEWSF